MKESGRRGLVRVGAEAQTVVLLLCTTVAAVFFFVGMLYVSAFGFDVTDEGAWMQWAAPSAYIGGFTRFGFAYHPLYLLLDGDLLSLRRMNLWIMGIAAVLCAATVLRALFPAARLGAFPLAMLAVALAPAALLFNQNIAPTPSYNSLTLLAMLIAVAGAFAAERLPTRRSVVGWFALGVGGWLLFLARPTGAALLVIAVVVFLRTSGRWNLALAAASAAVATAGVFMTGMVIDGSPVAMIENMAGGAIRYSSNVPGYTPLHMLSRFVRPNLWQMVAAALIAGSAVGAVYATRRMRSDTLALLLPLLLPMVLILIGFGVFPRFFAPLQGMLVGAPSLAMAVAAWQAWRSGISESRDARVLAESVFLMLLPMIWAFGSNITYYRGNAGIFYVLAGASLLRLLPKTIRRDATVLRLGAYALAVQLCVGVTGAGFLASPYRHPGPLLAAGSPLRLGRSTQPVRVDAKYAAYFDEAAAAAQRAGLPMGTWIIDLTGVSPGLLHHFGAFGAGSPWLIGHYDTRDRQAFVMLAHESCAVMAGAWVLDEPGSRWRISASVLKSYGADLQSDFEAVAAWPSLDSPTTGGAGLRQILYRPTRAAADAAAACRAR